MKAIVLKELYAMNHTQIALSPPGPDLHGKPEPEAAPDKDLGGLEKGKVCFECRRYINNLWPEGRQK